MRVLNKATKHLAKARNLQADAEEVLREARAFTVAGEINEDGTYPGDNDEVRRLLKVHTKLVDGSLRHVAKANALLDTLV